MKRIVAIFLLLLFFLQVIPVMRFFASTKSVTYTVLDEDKPEDGKKEKKEIKEYLSAPVVTINRAYELVQYQNPLAYTFPAPYLEFFSPPPNAAC